MEVSFRCLIKIQTVIEEKYNMTTKLAFFRNTAQQRSFG